ncbi:hypothetical protein HED60_01560 [Planctomycetales bacterium ZRK34]|nr:hypothetical protein HED60_01560 [Planctomycetales bacterium ZRK34]
MNESRETSLPPILPVGTAVVTRVEVRDSNGRPIHPAGAAGVIVRAPADPEHGYGVRFPGGDEVTLKRRDLHLLKHFQQAGFDLNDDPLVEYDLFEHVIYRCVIGSQAYGLTHDGSDTDRRGVYLPPAHMQWSLYGVPEQLENVDTEECYWELEKFLKLALKANPNVLEVLYSPIVEQVTPIAQQMLDMRSIFLSKLVYQTYNGYAMSQFKKLGQADRCAAGWAGAIGSGMASMFDKLDKSVFSNRDFTCRAIAGANVTRRVTPCSWRAKLALSRCPS